ncbi:MAG: glutamate formimidoyltransferase [Acidobacteria bacterium]|nr:glutamate formimidoyltransferase [Acidobacteriota bacterium]
MSRQIIECVPNFSEGRDPRVIAEIVESVRSVPGAALLASESDPDHHRSVLTIAGEPEPVVEAAFRAAATAALHVDLNHHRGVHPRIGATDVIPLVPVANITMEECAALAHRLGRRIWKELSIPVYFYEAAAMRPERRRLEVVRKGGFEALRDAAADAARQPDVGGPQPHPTAGATAIGARKFLLAFNINLATADVEIARAIAKSIRTSSGGLPHVKAMGVLLASRGLAQVSMNLTDHEVTPLHTVYELVARQAAAHGVSIAGSEIIGLMPGAALAQAAAHFLKCENYRRESILESRLITALIG